MVLIISNIVSTIGIDSFDIEKKIGVRRVTMGIPLQSQRQSRSLKTYIYILTVMADLLLDVSHLCLTQPEEGTAWAEQQLAR